MTGGGRRVLVLLLLALFQLAVHSKGGTGGRPYGYGYGYVGYGKYPGYYSPYGYGRPSMLGDAGFMVLPASFVVGGYYTHSHYSGGHHRHSTSFGASGWTPAPEEYRGCVEYSDPCGCAFDRLMDFMNNNCTLMFVAGATEALCASDCRRFLKTRTEELLGYCSDDPLLTPGLRKELRDVTIQYGLQCTRRAGQYCVDYVLGRSRIALEDVNWTDPHASAAAQAAYCAPCMSLAGRLQAAYSGMARPDPALQRALARGAHLSRLICGEDADGRRCFPGLAAAAGLGAVPPRTPSHVCGAAPCPGVWQRGDAGGAEAVVSLPALLPLATLSFNVTAQPTSGAVHRDGWWRSAFRDWRFLGPGGGRVRPSGHSATQTATGLEMTFHFASPGALLAAYEVTVLRNTSSLVLGWVVNGTAADWPAAPVVLQFAIVPAHRTAIAQNLTAVFASPAGPVPGLEALDKAVARYRAARDASAIARLLAAGRPQVPRLCQSGNCVQRLVWDAAALLSPSAEAQATAARLRALAPLLCLQDTRGRDWPSGSASSASPASSAGASSSPSPSPPASPSPSTPAPPAASLSSFPSAAPSSRASPSAPPTSSPSPSPSAAPSSPAAPAASPSVSPAAIPSAGGGASPSARSPEDDTPGAPSSSNSPAAEFPDVHSSPPPSAPAYCATNVSLPQDCTPGAAVACPMAGCAPPGLQCCVYTAALYSSLSGTRSTSSCASDCTPGPPDTCEPPCPHSAGPRTYYLRFDAAYRWYQDRAAQARAALTQDLRYGLMPADISIATVRTLKLNELYVEVEVRGLTDADAARQRDLVRDRTAALRASAHALDALYYAAHPEFLMAAADRTAYVASLTPSVNQVPEPEDEAAAGVFWWAVAVGAVAGAVCASCVAAAMRGLCLSPVCRGLADRKGQSFRLRESAEIEMRPGSPSPPAAGLAAVPTKEVPAANEPPPVSEQDARRSVYVCSLLGGVVGSALGALVGSSLQSVLMSLIGSLIGCTTGGLIGGYLGTLGCRSRAQKGHGLRRIIRAIAVKSSPGPPTAGDVAFGPATIPPDPQPQKRA